jgi:hypothetical protein
MTYYQILTYQKFVFTFPYNSELFSNEIETASLNKLVFNKIYSTLQSLSPYLF